MTIRHVAPSTRLLDTRRIAAVTALVGGIVTTAALLGLVDGGRSIPMPTPGPPPTHPSPWSGP